MYYAGFHRKYLKWGWGGGAGKAEFILFRGGDCKANQITKEISDMYCRLKVNYFEPTIHVTYLILKLHVHCVYVYYLSYDYERSLPKYQYTDKWGHSSPPPPPPPLDETLVCMNTYVTPNLSVCFAYMHAYVYLLTYT